MLQLIQMLKEDIGWLFLIPSVLLILSGSVSFAMFICEVLRRLGEQSPRLNSAYISET